MSTMIVVFGVGDKIDLLEQKQGLSFKMTINLKHVQDDT